MPDTEADGVINTLASDFTRRLVCDPADVVPEEGCGGFYVHGGNNFYDDLEDPRPLLRQRTLPLLVLQGACGTVPFAGAYGYVDLFPNARYRFIPGAGHTIWCERPDECRRAIEEFLGTADDG